MLLSNVFDLVNYDIYIYIITYYLYLHYFIYSFLQLLRYFYFSQTIFIFYLKHVDCQHKLFQNLNLNSTHEMEDLNDSKLAYVVATECAVSLSKNYILHLAVKRFVNFLLESVYF